ncbi:LytR/AlgR family response regulator transcription factor [Dyadobacter luticola]|uniref:LytTR family transcriptional regulator n=1 Tax=Dyadobacter luticola TaxID=1979387 RepID=A0A5R9L191_9BACT|nr:LytTR family DNA-binding domain-containing protein [Dyadobacter luticola]TLV02127.1 LytTR family transcriptional regulator [Dyadobacter luticola]
MKALLNQTFPVPTLPSIEIPNQTSITVYNMGRAFSIRTVEITHFEGVGNYTFACTRNGRYLISKCLKTIHDMVGNDFVRVHKSYIINRQHIKSRLFSHIQLSCGKDITIARRRLRETHETLAIK